MDLKHFDEGVQMARTPTTGSGLTPGQALYVVDRLVRERRLNPREVSRIAAEMQSEIAELERRLAMLRNDSSRAAGRAGKTGRRPMTAAVAASRRLQGEYMGLMRHVTGRERSRIKKLAAEKGREAAVREMRSRLGK
jgi:hypothetical protein